MYIRLIAWQTQRVIVECQFDILPCESAAAFARGKANAAHFGSEGRTTRGCPLNRGVVLEVNSRCKNLLEFQALQGFARLSEATIRKVCEEMKWTISASPTGADEDHHLAVVGMLNLDTSLTEEEVVQRILHRQESDKLTPEADDQELEMIVRDTLLSGEQDQALKELTRRRTTVTAKSLRPKVQKMYQRAAMDVKGWLDKKAVEARKLKEKSVTGDARAFDKNIERVYAQLNASVDEKMKALLPLNVRAWSDEKNGRWKLTYKGKYAQYGRSISWTSIGHSLAAAECVRQGWDWLDLHEGRTMPETVQAKLRKLSG